MEALQVGDLGGQGKELIQPAHALIGDAPALEELGEICGDFAVFDAESEDAEKDRARAVERAGLPLLRVEPIADLLDGDGLGSLTLQSFQAILATLEVIRTSAN